MISIWGRINLDSYPSTYTELDMKCVTDIYMKAKTLKLLGEKIRENLHENEVGKYYFTQDSKSINHKKKKSVS